MNYQHVFHAGNFADVFKHVVLMRVLTHMNGKPTPWRVVDTHAGAGLYSLKSDEANRTGEWVDGVKRFLDASFSPTCEAILAPYRAALQEIAPLGDLYPGSPLFIQQALRQQDRALCNELAPPAFARLNQLLRRDSRFALTMQDAYQCWKAQIPPPEKRGLILVDPPFESDQDFVAMQTGLRLMAKKWAHGSALLWYPIKNSGRVQEFERLVREEAIGAATMPRSALVLHLSIAPPREEAGLTSCGILLINPPWTLEAEMRVLLPELAKSFAQKGQKGGWFLEKWELG